MLTDMTPFKILPEHFAIHFKKRIKLNNHTTLYPSVTEPFGPIGEM